MAPLLLVVTRRGGKSGAFDWLGQTFCLAIAGALIEIKAANYTTCALHIGPRWLRQHHGELIRAWRGK
jgi:hypothetical protein